MPTKEKLNAIAAEQARKAANTAVERRKAEASEKPGSKVTLPYGVQADAEEFLDIRFDFQENPHLAHPEAILKHPDPEYKYAWARKSDLRTASMIGQGYYIPVKKDEMKEGAPVTHDGTDDGVFWYDLRLVKVPRKVWKSLYNDPAFFNTARLARLQEGYREDVERVSKGQAEYSFRQDVQ